MNSDTPGDIPQPFVDGTLSSRPIAPSDRVAASLRKLKRGSPIREAAEQYLQFESIPSSAEVHIDALASKEKGPYHERMVALWLAAGIRRSPESRRSLTQALVGQINKNEALRGWCCGCGLLGMLLTLTPIAIVPFIMLFLEHRANLQRMEVVRTLGALGDPGALRDVAVALWPAGDRPSPYAAGIQESAEAAFPLLANQLTDAYYGQMHDETIRAVCRALNHGSWNVQIAALKALKHIAGGRAVKAVENYRRQLNSDALRATADEVLAVLYARAENEKQAARLLRPVSAPDGEENLLRPAQGGEGDPSQLLRPVQADEEDNQENQA